MKTISLKFFHPKDGGFNLVLHNGFLYKEKQIIKNGHLLRCVNDGCPSRLATNLEKKQIIRNPSEDCHNPEFEYIAYKKI